MAPKSRTCIVINFELYCTFEFFLYSWGDGWHIGNYIRSPPWLYWPSFQGHRHSGLPRNTRWAISDGNKLAFRALEMHGVVRIFNSRIFSCGRSITFQLSATRPTESKHHCWQQWRSGWWRSNVCTSWSYQIWVSLYLAPRKQLVVIVTGMKMRRSDAADRECGRKNVKNVDSGTKTSQKAPWWGKKKKHFCQLFWFWTYQQRLCTGKKMWHWDCNFKVLQGGTMFLINFNTIDLKCVVCVSAKK